MLELFAVARQTVRLDAGHPLHAVLDAAQEQVRVLDDGALFARDEAAAAQALERVKVPLTRKVGSTPPESAAARG